MTEPSPGVRATRASARAETYLGELDLVKSLAGDVKELIVEFARTAVSNPLTGFVLSMVVTNVLYRAKVIDDLTFKAIFVALCAAMTVDIAIDATGLFSIFGGGSAQSNNAELVRPNAVTIVQSPTGGASGHGAGGGIPSGLMSRLMGLVDKAGASEGAAEVAIPAGAML